ncbi:hypothetical protein [uncultured Roseibium sp.]|uniref:hypothetical protein n=1 Tax=uncultured Roseibium sp. TaxID=1936171 RepID=UPI0026081566|nr:hypothetical protein [uncultured Roseibium sp.]
MQSGLGEFLVIFSEVKPLLQVKQSLQGLWATLFLLLTGCAGIPVETLTTYADAFAQARDAGDLLLDEISPIVSAKTSTAGDARCGTSRLGYPLCFDPDTARSQDNARINEDPSIVARRDALEAITLYNNMLVDIAEGKRSEEFGNRIDELVRLANSVAAIGVVPSGGMSALIPPSASYAKDLANRLGQARANATVRQSILRSKDDIQELIQALADDTTPIYNIFRKAREIDLFNIRADRRIAELSGDTKAVAAANKRFSAISLSIKRFHESLTAYVNLLDQTSEALDVLVAAAETPQLTVANLTEVAVEAEEIRRRSNAFWVSIRKVRLAAAGSQ